ncbi:MAG: ABC transporter permease [Deltaproteobacteria bacterium]|nr:ABC transporter permease [Deltaproteobacteria bacterium]
MKSLPPKTPRYWATAGIVVFCLLAAIGPEAATALFGFKYDEQHTAFPFAPPGFRDVPNEGQTFDNEKGWFDILLTSGVDGNDQDKTDAARGLACFRDDAGVLKCNVLKESHAAFRKLSLLMAEAWQIRGALGTISVIQIHVDLARWPGWAREVTAVCAPRTCTLTDLLDSTRFLRISTEGLLEMDSNHDGMVEENEFVGAPVLKTHLLGSDGLGRDSLVRLLRGLRMSVLVGGIAAGVASVIGVAYGSVAGMAPKWVGGLMMRIVDVAYGLPYIFIVILLISLVGPSTMNLLIAIAAVQWLGMSRTVRGLVGSLLKTPYVDAARTQGCGPMRLALTHLVPNARRPIVTWAALLVPASIKEEAFLSFLGLGVQAPDASLGTLIADGAQRIGDYPWLVAAPSILLFVLVLLIHSACDQED